ncbi:MAG: alpha/beta hydrolase [Pseudomonadota bacterium]|nr:alpha/beta hydrolase [Pseudomonadota bacterium]
MHTPRPGLSQVSDPPDNVDGATWLTVQGRSIFGVWRCPPVDDRPSLVFLHDGLGSVGTMRRFPEQTASALDLPAFVFDRLGYGRSDHEDEFPLDFMGEAADFLEDVLEVAGITDCCLIGHSDGGTVALLHGARYTGRVRAIVTVAAHVRRDDLTYGQVLRHNKMYRDGNTPDWMTRFHGERADHLLKCWAEVWQRTLYDSWDICHEIAAINIPLLSIQGSKDAYGLPSQLEGIKNAVKHAQVDMIEGLGHFPQLEDPDLVVARIERFLAPYCGQ